MENLNFGVGYFFFNIFGVWYYGNGKNDSRVVGVLKLIIDKEMKLGFYENFGLNCYWKIIKGVNGVVIIFVVCFGEFYKFEVDNKGGLEEVG